MKRIKELIEYLEKQENKALNDFDEISWEEAKQNPEKKIDKAYYDGIREGLKIALFNIRGASKDIDDELIKLL